MFHYFLCITSRHLVTWFVFTQYFFLAHGTPLFCQQNINTDIFSLYNIMMAEEGLYLTFILQDHAEYRCKVKPTRQNI
jgi:hypothetical protein